MVEKWHVCNHDIVDLKVKKWIDHFLSVFSEKFFQKASQEDRRDSKPNDNPIIIHSEIKKRAKKYEREIKKIYQQSKKDFNEKYSNLKSPTRTFLFRKADISLDQWYVLISWLLSQEELQDTFIQQFVDGELNKSFMDVLWNTIIEFNLDFPKWFGSIDPRVVEEYTKFNIELSKRIITRQEEVLKNIVTFGIEDGQSNDTIAKNIRTKFDFFTNYEAKRIARTETIRASSRWALAAYDELWVKFYELLPADWACMICTGKASQNPYRLDDASARPPLHPSCRCSTLPVIWK